MIRIRTYRRLSPDDFMLLLGCVTLIAANIVLYISLSDLYWTENLNSGYGPMVETTSLLPKLPSERIDFTRKMLKAFMGLGWTSIYAIKFCFLIFFHQLINQIGRLLLIWKIILGITVLFYCMCMTTLLLNFNCPLSGTKFGESS